MNYRPIVILSDQLPNEAVRDARARSIDCQLIQKDRRAESVLVASMLHYERILHWWIAGGIRRTVAG